jgi:hypothetical protein
MTEMDDSYDNEEELPITQSEPPTTAKILWETLTNRDGNVMDGLMAIACSLERIAIALEALDPKAELKAAIEKKKLEEAGFRFCPCGEMTLDEARERGHKC